MYEPKEEREREKCQASSCSFASRIYESIFTLNVPWQEYNRIRCFKRRNNFDMENSSILCCTFYRRVSRKFLTRSSVDRWIIRPGILPRVCDFFFFLFWTALSLYYRTKEALNGLSIRTYNIRKRLNKCTGRSTRFILSPP